MEPAPPDPAPPAAPPGPPAVRRMVHVCVFFLCLFLFVRTFALEPFGVPTGSMAGTMLGNHREAPCPRCGYPVCVGDPGAGIDRPAPYADACCPNCGKRGIDLSRVREIPGDRLLVDKNVFAARDPRRWEVAVFRCPVDNSKPYVKRVVGLPGERIQVIDGDVYADGELQRKTLSQVRETTVPVFDPAFAPPGGWGPRWTVEPVAGDMKLPTDPFAPPVRPADAMILRDDGIHLDATAGAVGLTYRNYNLDDKEVEAVKDGLGYNGPVRRGRQQSVHDFVFACDLEILSGAGSVAVRLGDGADTVAATLVVGPVGRSQVGRDGGYRAVEFDARLAAGATYRLEFSFIDRRVILAVDGREVLPPQDLPPPAGPRGGVPRPLQLGARGVHAAWRNAKLGRDIHYRAEGANAVNTPYPLGPDEYFVLGDNSFNSHDGREWKIPGVPGRDFIGKPFLIHQPLKAGRVTVGGEDRTFQTVDWSRLKWLR